MAFLRQEIEQAGQMLRRSRPPHQPGADLLRAEHLSLRFDTGIVLDDLSFSVQKSERVAVVGPNGAGKSTLFRIIAGVLKPSHGKVTIMGQEPGGHICIAYVPQRSHVDWRFPVSVRDVVMMGRIGQIGLLRQPSHDDQAKVNAALEATGLTTLAKRQIGELSGGQQQRMFIARALAQEAELMLMDEPLTGLDAPTQDDLFRILEMLKQRGVGVLVALHDLNLAATHFERVMLLNKRLIGFGKPEEVLQPVNLQQAYHSGLQLLPSDDGTIMALSDTCCDHDEED